MSDVSEPVVASIAQALNSNQIPAVLWGHYLLNVHGIPSIIASIDFVIPDHSLEAGSNILLHLERLTACPATTPDLCLTSSQERHTPPPAFHVHVKDSEITVNLYPQSETLWFLPPLDPSLARPKTLTLPSSFVLASDQNVLPRWRPGRGTGLFKVDHDPVIVPKSHILLEAFLRLYARDTDKRIGSFAMAMIAYMEEYVDDDGLLDASLLPEPLKTFYNDLRQGKTPVRQWTKDLQKSLGVLGDSGNESE